MKIELKMDIPPSVNRIWRQGVGGKVYRSNQYVDWQKKTLWEIKLQAKGKNIVGPYHIRVIVERRDKRKRDLDNFIKAINDVLTTSNIIEDDHLCQSVYMAWGDSGTSCYVTLEAADGQAE